MSIILLFILWFAAAVSIIAELGTSADELKTWEQFIVAAIITLGTPFMLVTQAIETILDIFLKEGRDDE